MKYLVLGGTGMAGHVVVLTLRAHGHDVDVVARSRQLFSDAMVLDLRDVKSLEAVVADGRYDAVINCVGLLVEDSSRRPDQATLINAYLPQRMARILRNTRTRLVHLSTDCVFSGKGGPYAEDDELDGQRPYDRSKALGEINNHKDLTLRLSIIGPELSPRGSGLFDWFMHQSGELNGFTQAWWSGITTIELAQALEQLTRAEVSGLVHLVPTESLTKYDLLVLLNEVFDRGLSIKPVDDHSADRRLRTNRTDLPYEVSDYGRQLGDMRLWIQRHRDLYPHYEVDPI